MKHIKDLQTVTDRTLEARLASLEKAWQQRQERKPKEQPEKPKTAEIVQLPLWPEPARGVPNSALRGALFAAIQGKDRRYIGYGNDTLQNGPYDLCKNSIANRVSAF